MDNNLFLRQTGKKYIVENLPKLLEVLIFMQINKHFFLEKSKVICLFTLHNDLLGSIQHPEKMQIVHFL